MAENVLKLKKQAVELGMSRDDAKKASRPVLEAFIKGASSGSENSDEPRKVAKKKTKTVAKKSSKKSASSDENTSKKTTKKGKKATTKKAERKQTRKTSEKKTTRKPARVSNDDEMGRFSIGSINWSVTADEWNPRKGGPVELLFKALKKAKGDIDKAFDIVRPDMYEYVGRNKRNGERRTKQEAENMLRYRLNRTKFEFARRTGQHESASNRVEYGKGDYAKPKPKPRKTSAKKTSKPRKTTGKKGRKTSKK